MRHHSLEVGWDGGGEKKEEREKGRGLGRGERVTNTRKTRS